MDSAPLLQLTAHRPVGINLEDSVAGEMLTAERQAVRLRAARAAAAAAGIDLFMHSRTRFGAGRRT